MYGENLSHIVSIICENPKLCPPLESPLGEYDQNQGGEEEEKHLLGLLGKFSLRWVDLALNL